MPRCSENPFCVMWFWHGSGETSAPSTSFRLLKQPVPTWHFLLLPIVTYITCLWFYTLNSMQLVCFSMHTHIPHILKCLCMAYMCQPACYVLGTGDTNLNNSVMEWMIYTLIGHFLFQHPNFWCTGIWSQDLLGTAAICCCNKVSATEWYRKNTGLSLAFWGREV